MMHSMARMISFNPRGVRLLLVAVAAVWTLAASAHDASRLAPTDATRVLLPEAASDPMPLVPSSSAGQPGSVDFLGETASSEAHLIVDWVVASGDNGGLPFLVIDKIGAKVFVFDRDGRLHGAAAALLGKASGDDTVPGIGSRKLSAIRPEERTTPAGRFTAFLGRDFEQDILWIDYDSSLSLHRVITGAVGDHRLRRLATDSPLDNRISYGCVNVPVKFYEDVVRPIFTGTSGIVYILPEIKKIQDVFPIAAGAAGPSGASTPRYIQPRDNGP